MVIIMRTLSVLFLLAAVVLGSAALFMLGTYNRTQRRNRRAILMTISGMFFMTSIFTWSWQSSTGSVFSEYAVCACGASIFFGLGFYLRDWLWDP